MAREVQSITVQNQAGYSMTFWISYTGPDGKLHWSENNSGDFSVGFDRTLDLSQCHTNDKKIPQIPEGATVWATGHADLGKQFDAGDKVVYKKNGQKATYRAKGTTLNPSFELV
jgi:hypothetical protein